MTRFRELMRDAFFWFFSIAFCRKCGAVTVKPAHIEVTVLCSRCVAERAT